MLTKYIKTMRHAVMPKIRFFGALVALNLAIATTASATIISTPGDDEVGSFVGNEVYGQSFLVGAHNVMERVQLWGRAFAEDQGLIFELFSFNSLSSTVNGGPLFSTTGVLLASSELNMIDILTDGWSLTSGQHYLFSMRHDDGDGNGRWGYDFSTDNYTDGAFYYSRTENYLTNAWATNFGGQSRDLRFEMTFSDGVTDVPAPVGMTILLMGLVGLGMLRHRKAV